jgi:hypothetical protein
MTKNKTITSPRRASHTKEGIYKLNTAIVLLKEASKSQTEEERIGKYLGVTLNLIDFCKNINNEGYAKKFEEQAKILKIVLNARKKTHAFLSIFLDDKTRIQYWEKGLAPNIQEEYDLTKWKKETCTITEKQDGTTEISFFGLLLRLPTKKVKYQEEVTKDA